MTDFTKLENINTEKYHLTISSDDVDGRIDRAKVPLLDGGSYTEAQIIDQDFRFKFKETRFLAEIYIEIDDSDFGQSKTLTIESKLENQSTPIKYDASWNDDSNLEADIFSFSDEIVIRPSTTLAIKAITIFFFQADDFREMLSDISKVRTILEEIKSTREEHANLVRESHQLTEEHSIEREKLNETEVKLKSVKTELSYSQEKLDKVEYQLQSKNELAEKRNDELSKLAASLREQNSKLRRLSREVGRYTDTLDGYRDESKHTKRSYFLLSSISLFLIGLCVHVLIDQALLFSNSNFDSLNEAVSYLIAKAPVTAAMVTATIILYNFTKYCVDIIRNISNQSLELTKFSVIAKHIVEDTEKSASENQTSQELNKQKSIVIGELMAKKWSSESLESISKREHEKTD